MAATARKPVVVSQALIGAGALAIGIFMAVGATSIPSHAGYAGVGPNFLPWLVSLSLVVCGGFIVWESRSGGFRALEQEVEIGRAHV